MPYVVTQSCCADASCVVACPVNCIHPAPGEPGFATAEMVYIDADSCVGCGACVTACPVGAIKPDTKLAPQEAVFADLAADYFEVFPHPDRRPLAAVEGQRRLLDPRPVRVAVIGSGPAGLYAADDLLRHPEISVDVYDRLPTPYGLVRAGVAPDHTNTKRIERLLAQIESERGFGYRLGVEVGTDVTLAELAPYYDAVLYAVGAAADRRLDVPGEHLPGSLSATEVVGWYNGHPDRVDLDVALDHERVVIVGNGNVALDVARILTLDPDRLAATDIAPHALAALRNSRVREVVLLGRRGPAEAAFTLPELVGLTGLAESGEVAVEIDDGGVPADPTTPLGREIARLRGATARPGARRIVLRFLSSPVAITGDAQVTGVEVGRNALEVDAAGIRLAVPTGKTQHLPAGLVLRAIGYRGEPVADLPYDPATGTVPHDHGRVRPGVYVAGWVKRGPSGFIGTNKSCAHESVEALLDDLDAGILTPPVASSADLDRLLAVRTEVVDLAGWRAIDAVERAAGAAQGSPRRKLTDRRGLLAAARSSSTARGGRPTMRRRARRRVRQ